MTDRPTFQYSGEGFDTLRAEVYAGRGLKAACLACGQVAERTAKELLDRHWRYVDVPLREIMARSSCPSCGSKQLLLNFVRGGEPPFPLEPGYMSWEARAAHDRRRERFDAWVEEQRRAAAPPASYTAAKGR